MIPFDEEALAERVRFWWLEHAEFEIDGMLAKLMEYGTGDLHEIGRQLMEVGAAGDLDNPQQCYELGVLFYVVGKVQRALTAARLGLPASTDTWHDLAVYAKMVLAGRAGVMPS
jgi:hypothetical protein